jgi:hypothetical protein
MHYDRSCTYDHSYGLLSHDARCNRDCTYMGGHVVYLLKLALEAARDLDIGPAWWR